MRLEGGVRLGDQLPVDLVVADGRVDDVVEEALGVREEGRRPLLLLLAATPAPAAAPAATLRLGGGLHRLLEHVPPRQRLGERRLAAPESRRREQQRLALQPQHVQQPGEHVAPLALGQRALQQRRAERRRLVARDARHVQLADEQRIDEHKVAREADAALEQLNQQVDRLLALRRGHAAVLLERRRRAVHRAGVLHRHRALGCHLDVEPARARQHAPGPARRAARRRGQLQRGALHLLLLLLLRGLEEGEVGAEPLGRLELPAAARDGVAQQQQLLGGREAAACRDGVAARHVPLERVR